MLTDVKNKPTINKNLDEILNRYKIVNYSNDVIYYYTKSVYAVM